MSEQPTERMDGLLPVDHLQVPGVYDILGEAVNLALPNLFDVVRTEQEILAGVRKPLRPLLVRPPIPGRYASRPGERLSRRELMGAVDEWLGQTESLTRFIIQGGNRYINIYASEVFDHTIPDIKIMSAEKASLSVQLQTILTADERRSTVAIEQLDKIIPLLPTELRVQAASMSRAGLLAIVAGMTLRGPFSTGTSDERLQEELTEVSALIDKGIVIPNQPAISALMRGTAIADALHSDGPIHFLDDLFYRGRTLYSLAILMTACGGNPANMNLTTLCSDIKSVELNSPFHTVLRSGVLYPFENSVRTEQGYWQDVGTHYIFTNMGMYWEYLHSIVDSKQSQSRYLKWQSEMEAWSDQQLAEQPGEVDMSLVGPLLWLSVYHTRFGLDLDIDRIVDQKGYKIGACVPFMQLMDRFISQEEPVEVRRQFKDEIRNTLSAIQEAAAAEPRSYASLVDMYRENQQELDYQGMGLMTEPDTQHIMLSEGENKASLLMTGLAQNIAARALEAGGPFVVGINGVDGSGKTMLSTELRKQLEAHGLPVSVVHIDDFTRPHSRRASPSDPVERYYNNTFDIETLRDAILIPLAARQLGSVVLRHESPRDPSQIVEHGYMFTDGPSIVIVEGVFIFRPELAEYFDTKIFVDIPISEMRERAIERDVPRFGFGVLKKYLSRYIPAQERYFEMVRPFEIADIVINNSDWHNPYLIDRGAKDVQQTTS